MEPKSKRNIHSNRDEQDELNLDYVHCAWVVAKNNNE